MRSPSTPDSDSGSPAAGEIEDNHPRIGAHGCCRRAPVVSVPRTKTFGLYSRDVSEVDKTLIIQNIKSMFCYLLLMKVGYIDIWQLLLVVSFEKRAKMRLRKQANQKNLVQRQTSRCSWALNAIPSRERSHTHPVQLLNTFRARGAVFLGLAWFAIASHSQKRRDGWKNLATKQTNRWNWALDFISSRECSYGCLV